MRNISDVFIISICLLVLCVNTTALQAADSDAAVAQAQQQLKTLGYDPGPVDGLWGPKTAAALQQFQKAQGLAVTGRLDEQSKMQLSIQAARNNAADKTPAPIQRDSSVKKISLRAVSTALSKEQIVTMVREKGFHHPADLAEQGLSPGVAGNFPHAYDARAFYDEQVVIDHVTGLMWQQAAAEFVPGGNVQTHIAQVNAGRYAGYADWRLPTIEEFASLLTTSQAGVDFIDPIFDPPYWFCLSADTLTGTPTAPWVVLFEDGYIVNHTMDDDFYLLLVRSLQ